jgi:hypothetical protein
VTDEVSQEGSPFLSPNVPSPPTQQVEQLLGNSHERSPVSDLFIDHFELCISGIPIFRVLQVPLPRMGPQEHLKQRQLTLQSAEVIILSLCEDLGHHS